MTLDVDWTWILIVATTFFAAGIVKGIIGLGLPTIAMALLSALVAPPQAAAILVLPTLLTNVWQMLDGPYLKAIIRRLWPMLAGVVLGTLATSRILTAADSSLSTALVGGVLLIYAATALAGLRINVAASAEPILSPLAGATTGLINGATAIFAIPTIPYLQGLNLGKDEFVQTFGLFAFVASSALGFGLTINGVMSTGLALPALAAIAAAFAGMALGRRVRRHLSIDRFRRYVLVGLIALAGSMIYRGLK